MCEQRGPAANMPCKLRIKVNLALIIFSNVERGTSSHEGVRNNRCGTNRIAQICHGVQMVG